MTEYAIGIDLGGTKIAGALVTRDGRIAAEERLPTRREEGVEAVVDRVAACILSLRNRADGPIAGVGIGAAGMTDSRTGVVLLAANLQWFDVPLRDLLLQRPGMDTIPRLYVDKDTNASVLGELLFGAGRGTQHLFCTTVGTGVGGGMVINGRLYHGASEGASDIGHLVLVEDGYLCGCGKRGCVETLVSGLAIARQAQAALQEGRSSALSDLPRESITAVEVVAAARTGDALAREILAEAGRYLGWALAYYIDLNNPELIIIGGSVSLAAGELFMEPVRQTIAARALPPNVRAARLSLPGLGQNAGEVGAAALVWHHLDD